MTPTQLLVRWSCGCMPENVRQAAVALRDVAKTGKLENKREAALACIAQFSRALPIRIRPSSIQGCVWPRLGWFPAGT